MSAPSTSVVFVDLDSTLADTRHRWHMIGEGDERERTDWVAYAMACANDAPVPGAVRLVQLLSEAGLKIVILSGREAKADFLTRRWLIENFIPHDDVLLRDTATMGGTNGEYKRRRMLEWLESHPGHRALLVIDDWPEVRERMEEVGVPTLTTSPPQIEKPMYEYAVEELENPEIKIGD